MCACNIRAYQKVYHRHYLHWIGPNWREIRAVYDPGVGGCHLDPELDPGTLELGGLDPLELRGLDPGTLKLGGLDPELGA